MSNLKDQVTWDTIHKVMKYYGTKKKRLTIFSAKCILTSFTSTIYGTTNSTLHNNKRKMNQDQYKEKISHRCVDGI